MKYLILLAGGTGSRTGLAVPKQFLEVNNEMLINHLLKRVEDEFDEIVIVLNQHYLSKNIYKSSKMKIVLPGSERILSIINGLNAIDYNAEDHIYIHDAARVLLSKMDIEAHEACLMTSDAVISVGTSVDTMFVTEDNIIKKVYKKTQIVRGLTPQSYKGKILDKGYLSTIKSEMDLTEVLPGVSFSTVNQLANLRKVTTPEDVEWIKGEL